MTNAVNKTIIHICNTAVSLKSKQPCILLKRENNYGSKALTDLNIGENLDNLANLDPRGYGVCRILYKASREYTGMPTTMNAAKKLCATLKKTILYI